MSIDKMFMRVWLFGIFSSVCGTCALHFEETQVSCEEFEQGARFDPYLAVDSTWKIFYFWSNSSEVYPIIFSLPAQPRIDKFRQVVEVVDKNLARMIEWHKVSFFMEPRPGVMAIFVYLGSPGAFRAFVKSEQRKSQRPHPTPLISFADVRMKMVGRIVGLMVCEDLSTYALARVHEMPVSEEECEIAALQLGLPLTNGRSYLFLANYTKHHEAATADEEL